jgi:hypothetical protein
VVEDSSDSDDGGDDSMVRRVRPPPPPPPPPPKRAPQQLQQPQPQHQPQRQPPPAPPKGAPLQRTKPSPPIGSAASFAGVPWPQKHAPAESTSVALFKKKVEEVGAWLSAAVASSHAARRCHVSRDAALSAMLDAVEGLTSPSPLRLLVLSGPPGTGKSTLVRLLCRERGWGVREFVDPSAVGGLGDSWQRGGAAGFRGSAGSSGGGGSGEGGAGEEDALEGVLRHIYRVEREGQARRAGALEESEPHREAASGPRQGALEAFLDFLSQAKKYRQLELQPSVGVAAPSSSSSSSSSFAGAPGDAPSRQILLVEDLPRVPSHLAPARCREWRAKFQAGIAAYTTSLSSPPLVLIVSEGEEPGDSPTLPSLKAMLGHSTVESPQCTVIEVDRCADTRLRAVLEGIVEREAGPGGLGQAAAALGRASVGGIIRAARGDVRHAVCSLEFVCMGGRGVAAVGVGGGSAKGGSKPGGARAAAALPAAAQDKSKGKGGGEGRGGEEEDLWGLVMAGGRGGAGGGKRSSTSALGSKRAALSAAAAATSGAAGGEGGGGVFCGRDDFYDALHTLGKLLHSKRRNLECPGGEAERNTGADTPLAFDPDSLVEESSYDSGVTSAFLAHNCPLFHTDIAHLARTLDVFSACDALTGGAWGRAVARSRGGSGAAARSGGGGDGDTSQFPERYAASLCSRATAVHNKAPAPPSYRPTRKPAQYAVGRVAEANMRWITQEALGLGWDIGHDAFNTGMLQSYAAASPAQAPLLLSVSTSSRVRAVEILPALSLMLRQARSQQRGGSRGGGGGSGSESSTAPALSRLTPRAAALILASSESFCVSGGPRWSHFSPAGDLVTQIGASASGGTLALHAAASSSGGGRGGAKDGGGGDTLVGAVEDAAVDEEGEGGGEGEGEGEGAAQQPLTSIFRQGMQWGMWQTACAEKGVSVTSAHGIAGLPLTALGPPAFKGTSGSAGSCGGEVEEIEE